MNNKYLQIAVLVILAAAALFLIPRQHAPEPMVVTDFSTCRQAGGSIVDGEPVKCVMPDGRNFPEAEMAIPDVIVDQPGYGDLVTSPMTVKGRARGSWYFEANLPVTLKDTNGVVLAQKGLYAQSDWMTANYVDFNDTLTFPMPTTQYGVLIISKDNPSGDPINDASFAVPVKFW